MRRYLKLKKSFDKVTDHIITKLRNLREEIQNNTLINNETEKYDNSPFKIKPKNTAAICEHLEEFIEYIRESKFECAIRGCSKNLERRIKVSLEEIECMLGEIRSICINIERQKNQQKYFRKETNLLKKTLEKMQEKEIEEMEVVISMFDEQMYNRWQDIKTSHDTEVLEELRADIKNRQVAMENLEDLISRKLTNIQISSESTESLNNKEETAILNPNIRKWPSIPKLELESILSPSPSLPSSILNVSSMSSFDSERWLQIDKCQAFTNML